LTGRFGYPGDPPIADILAVGGTFALLLGFVVFLVLRPVVRRVKEQSVRRLLGGMACLLLALGMILVAWGWASVGRRHLGSWAEMRDFARSRSHQIEKELGGRRRLTDGEYAGIAAGWRAERIVFAIGPPGAQVRPHLFYDYPYVGFDFGDGLVAVFSPVTMLCLGAD
jgi:hypothetical protein